MSTTFSHQSASRLNKDKHCLLELVLLTVVLIWGLNCSIIKLLSVYFNPLAFTTLRFIVSALAVATLLKVSGAGFRIDREDIRAVIWLGLISNTLYQFLVCSWTGKQQSGNAGLFMALTAIFAYLIGILLRRENFQLHCATGDHSFAGGSFDYYPGWHARSFLWPNMETNKYCHQMLSTKAISIGLRIIGCPTQVYAQDRCGE